MRETFFQCEALNPGLIRIRDITSTACYFVLGTKRGMLLDTGVGAGDLRSLTDSLTQLPYDVLLTHGHMDHVGGASRFSDKTVYLHPADRELMRENAAVRVRADFIMKNSGGSDFAELDMPAPYEPDRTHPMTDGQEFDLGGLHLSVIHTPGHTRGMCMVLIREMRTILFGDGCGVLVLLLEDCSCTVSEYLNTLEKVKSHESEYDRVLRNHGTCESKPSLLVNVMDCCRDILTGKDDHIPIAGLPLKSPDAFLAKAVQENTVNRLDGKEGNLVYTTSKI